MITVTPIVQSVHQKGSRSGRETAAYNNHVKTYERQLHGAKYNLLFPPHKSCGSII
jgi:hypothetical protein